MSSLMQGICGACKHKTAHHPDNVGAVVPEKRPKNRDAYANDPQFMLLPFKGEKKFLEERDLDFFQLAQQGRFYMLRGMACKACGHLYDTRKISSGVGGCLPAFAIGCAVGACITFLYGNLIWGLGMMFITSVVAGGMVERKGTEASRKAAADAGLDLEVGFDCPQCESEDTVMLSGKPQSVKCAACGEHGLSVMRVGKT